MQPTRRQLLQSAAATPVGFAGLRHLIHEIGVREAHAASAAGYGMPVEDPEGVFDLPEGFSYQIISRHGEEMDDGLLVPNLHDGTAAYRGPGGKIILVRNHELLPDELGNGPFGKENERLGRVDRDRFYDYGHGKAPGLGGTTTLVYDTKKQRLEKHFLSLIGTGRNCAGGLTPWDTWLSCEEWTKRADDEHEKDHGYVFEVPISAKGPVDPVPIKAMGRFNHEAVSVDPASGVVYLTEDRGDGLLYRFIPNKPGAMHKGGRLQALAVRDKPRLDTRNYLDSDGNPLAGSTVEVGARLPVQWIDLDAVEAPKDDLRRRGFADGAAKFARGEGMWYGRGSIFFACTSGGAKQLGQIWRYVPSEAEGTADEESDPGHLELFIEPRDSKLLERADNLTIAPSGDLFVCEDGPDTNRLIHVTPDGKVTPFGRNAYSKSELAGATFSPDGSTLFVHIQHQGLTLAITGPWRGRDT